MDLLKLPSDWVYQKLGSLCIQGITKGTTPTTYGFQYQQSGIPFIKIENLTPPIVEKTQIKAFVPPGFNQRFSRSILKPNDILFSIAGTLGKVAIVPSELDGANTNQALAIIRLNCEKADNKYVMYFLMSPFIASYIANSKVVAAQPNISLTQLANFKIPIPYPNDPPRSLETQRRIVARLEALLAEVAEARKLQEQITEDTEELPEAFLGEVFTTKDGWQPQAISEFADVKGGKRLPKGQPFADGTSDFPYLRVVDFKNFSIDQGELRYLTPETRERIKHYTISKDDVYISIAGTNGQVGTDPADLDGANLTENAAKIVIHPEYKHKVDNKFLAYYLASPLGKLQIQQGTKAAGQPKLALMRIETIEVPLPDIDIQQQVVNYIDSVRAEIREMQRAQQENSELIAQLEQSLLAQAFRGEL